MTSRNISKSDSTQEDRKSGPIVSRRAVLSASLLGAGTIGALAIPEIAAYLEKEQTTSKQLFDGALVIEVTRNENFDGKITRCALTFETAGCYRLSFVRAGNLEAHSTTFVIEPASLPLRVSTYPDPSNDPALVPLKNHLRELRGCSIGSVQLNVEFSPKGRPAIQESKHL